MVDEATKNGFVILLEEMRKESERMAKEYDTPGHITAPLNEVIASIASKQAAICTMIIEILEDR